MCGLMLRTCCCWYELPKLSDGPALCWAFLWALVNRTMTPIFLSMSKVLHYLQTMKLNIGLLSLYDSKLGLYF